MNSEILHGSSQSSHYCSCCRRLRSSSPELTPGLFKCLALSSSQVFAHAALFAWNTLLTASVVMSAFLFNLLFPASVFLHKKSLFFNSGFRTLALCISVYDHLCHGSFYIALRILHRVSISFTRLDLSHRQCYLVHHCISSKTHVQQAFLKWILIVCIWSKLGWEALFLPRFSSPESGML